MLSNKAQKTLRIKNLLSRDMNEKTCDTTRDFECKGNFKTIH